MIKFKNERNVTKKMVDFVTHWQMMKFDVLLLELMSQVIGIINLNWANMDVIRDGRSWLNQGK